MTTIALLVFLSTLGGVVFGWYARVWMLRHRTPHERKAGAKCCDYCLCDLPKDARRDYLGRWRCAEHKHVGDAA